VGLRERKKLPFGRSLAGLAHKQLIHLEVHLR
jgi:hypothetical protein